MASYYVHVIVPLALRGVFTYAVPEEIADEVLPGKRVVVPFGPKRLYSAIVYRMDAQPSKGTKPKPIAYTLDDEPIVTDRQLRFWEWLANYYMCGLGAVMITALPGSIRLSSQTTVMLNEREVELPELTADEQMVLANLQRKNAVTVDVLEKLSSKAAIQRALDKLLKHGLIELNEEMADQMAPKTVDYVRITDAFAAHDALSEFMDALTRAPRQLELMMRFIELSEFFQGTPQPVPKRKLLELANSNTSVLQTLVGKGVFDIESRLEGLPPDADSLTNPSLSESQVSALTEVHRQWEEKDVVLLHGVTGSGKTLVYSEAAQRVLDAGKQVLYLVPEIALTTQLVERMKKLLGQEVMVYHSRYSNRERLTMWMRMLSADAPQVIIGARSSLFLPFRDLGLVVVDEEHEISYKQHESTPFYNARDAAIWLAASFKAKVLLGSATPSVETYHRASVKKFGLVTLANRYGDIKLPEIKRVDLRKAMANRQMQADFATETIDAIKETLRDKKQVIIFQNRRGYAPFQICESCGWSAECNNCDVNLTVHKYFEKLLCHYCGFSLKQPSNCPNCGSAKLKIKGYGTEKIEDDLEILFPEARIARMDLDTTRKKNALQNLITAFEEGSIDILVGTQMVTKGLDFEHVALVCVMNADSLWNRPDFRAFERAFQLLTQVAGRAGRKKSRGKVLVQAYRPDHPVLHDVIQADYELMFEQQLPERRAFDYPPFSRMVRFQVAHRDAKLVKEAAGFLAGLLRERFGPRLLGPEEPPIARIRNRYLRQMFLKLETNLSPQKSRQGVWECIDLMEGHNDFRKVRLHVDVDPL